MTFYIVLLIWLAPLIGIGYLLGYHAGRRSAATPAHAFRQRDRALGLLLDYAALFQLGYGSSEGPVVAALARAAIAAGDRYQLPTDIDADVLARVLENTCEAHGHLRCTGCLPSASSPFKTN